MYESVYGNNNAKGRIIETASSIILNLEVAEKSARDSILNQKAIP
jgi:hypothetical protein